MNFHDDRVPMFLLAAGVAVALVLYVGLQHVAQHPPATTGGVYTGSVIDAPGRGEP